MRSLTAASLLFVLLLTPRLQSQFVDGHIYVTDWTTNSVFDVDPVTGNWIPFLTAADGISGPSAVGFTATGNLLVSNYSTSQILEADPAGNVTVVLDASDGISGPWGENGIAIDGQRRIYIANYSRSEILRFDQDYTNPVVIANASDGIMRPDGLDFDLNGDLLVANRDGNDQIFRIDPNGNVTTFDVVSGDNPFSLTVRGNGDIYVCCSNGKLYRYVGGVAANRTLLGTYGSANVGLRLSSDGSVLYHTSSGEGKLRSIDPDTGADVVLVDAGWRSIGIAVFGTQNPPGSFIPFGSGLAGAGGMVPSLDGSGTPRIGGNIVIEARDFVGGAESFLVFGAGQTNQPLFGGSIYIDFTQVFWIHHHWLPGAAGVPGDGDLDIHFSIAADPQLTASNWYLQQVAADPASPFGISMSNGLRIFVGS